ncbi:MAG: DUF188 domain-containing protein [Neobacillus sp.]
MILLYCKGVYVITPKGTLFDETGIQTTLDLRYINAKARKRGVYGKVKINIRRTEQDF